MFYRLKRSLSFDASGQSRVGGMLGVRHRGLMWRESGAWKSKTDRGFHATMRDEASRLSHG